MKTKILTLVLLLFLSFSYVKSQTTATSSQTGGGYDWTIQSGNSINSAPSKIVVDGDGGLGGSVLIQSDAGVGGPGKITLNANGGTMLFNTYGITRMTLLNNGNFGIGTTNPLSMLSIGGDGSSYVGLCSKKSGTGSYNYGIQGVGESTAAAEWSIGVLGSGIKNASYGVNCVGLYGSGYAGETALSNGRSYGVLAYAGNMTSGYNGAVVGKLMGTNNGSAIVGTAPGNGEFPIPGIYAGYFLGNVYASGNVGIGCTNPTVALAVNGKIQATEVEIKSAPCSDYVFESNYKLMNLSELEKFVTANKHLPEIPSAKEFQEKGYSVGQMDDVLLRKVEELTLYIIELKKENDALKQEVKSLK